MNIGKEINIWRDIGMMLVIATIIVFSFVTIASANGNDLPYSAPMQDTIKKAMASEKIAESDIEGDPEYNLEILEKNDTHIKLKANTKIVFKDPKGAGYNESWPKFEIKDDLNREGNGTIIPGNYDQNVKDYILSEIQKIPDKEERSKKLKEWENYDFEHGSRTLIVEEIYEITYLEQPNLTEISRSSTSNDILMGFTEIKQVSLIVENKLVILGFVVWWYKAGFEFDGALGLRLPMSASLSLPNDLFDGNKYMLATSIKGIDWNADQYSAALVPPENGNEFVARLKFFIGVKVIIVNIPVIDWYLETDRNYGKSFKTPLGPNEEFPIPDMKLSADDTGIKQCWYGLACFGVGLNIDPDVGSESVTADWNTKGDALGRGSIKYKQPDATYNFGPMFAIDYDDTTDYANVKLSDFNYYFDKCNFDVAANLELGGVLSMFGSPYIHLFNVGCSDITGGLHLGTHSGTNADNIESSAIVKRNIISVPGFENPWIFYTNGIGTFLNNAPGVNSPHSGHITISKEGTNVQLYQIGLVLKPKTSYRLSFKAYSNSGHDLSVSLIKHDSPYTNYGLSGYVVNLGTSWKDYSVDFTTTEFSDIVNDGRLMFWLAPYDANGDQYYIDDVMITRI